MKREQLLKTLKTLVAAPVTEEILDKADAALADNASIITYLRGPRTVGRVEVPGKDDTPATTKLVICAGEPKAVLIAFVADEKLYIGWAKRNEEVFIPKTDKLLNQLLEIRNMDMNNPAMWDAFDRMVSGIIVEDREESFSKEIGRYIAFLTASSEVLTQKRGYFKSTRCKVVPSIVCKALPKFIARAERVSGLTAHNVIRE